MDSLVGPIIFMLIIGGIAGYFIGYLIKKISHFALIIGIFVFLLMYLVYTKSINLDLGELGATVTRFAESLAPLGLTGLVSSAPFVGSFVVGLVFGLKSVN
ncbi:MAG: FUN14 family protein [Candidatus Bathyarchaeota archaeon BA2]|nr:MAG: FUN14 family protein [Candidatus Bathyarchaeota archaeon BA2]